MATKKNIAPETIKASVEQLLHHSKDVKQRKFLETIEIHFGLKNLDPARDKRLAGTVKLPHKPRKNFKCLVLGNEKHNDEGKEMGLDFRTLDDLKKMNKDKRLVKKMGNSYDVILASDSIIRQIPRLLGPTLNKMGKFPTAVKPTETIQEKYDSMAATIKFAIKLKPGGPMCLSSAVANVSMTPEEINENVTAAVNYGVSLCKKRMAKC